jgi:hypothetical protein
MTDRKSENFPLALMVEAKPYRTLLFFSANGKYFAWLTGAVVLLGAVALWWSGYGVAWLPAGVVLAAVAVLMLNCFAELIDLIVDTMIPK